jgi:hypothetical protein
MISHKHKCVFFHIPKVAGQSIELFFLKLNHLDWENRESLLLKENHDRTKGPPRLAHLKSHEYVKYNYLNQKEFDSYYKFSFVRNPWARVVSMYKFGNYNHCISFSRFVKNILPRLIKKEEWFYGKQYNFIYHKNSINVDFVGRFENLNQDFGKVCDKLNLDFTRLPHKNKSEKKVGYKKFKQQLKFFMFNPLETLNFKPDSIKSKDYRDYYTSELIDLIYQMYKEDVETFNYKFDN